MQRGLPLAALALASYLWQNRQPIAARECGQLCVWADHGISSQTDEYLLRLWSNPALITHRASATSTFRIPVQL